MSRINIKTGEILLPAKLDKTAIAAEKKLKQFLGDKGGRSLFVRLNEVIDIIDDVIKPTTVDESEWEAYKNHINPPETMVVDGEAVPYIEGEYNIIPVTAWSGNMSKCTENQLAFIDVFRQDTIAYINKISSIPDELLNITDML